MDNDSEKDADLANISRPISTGNRTSPNIYNFTKILDDPVLEQTKRTEDNGKVKKKETSKKTDLINVTPSFGTRIDLHTKPDPVRRDGTDPLFSYVPPQTPTRKKIEKQQKEENKKFEDSLNFPKYDVINIPKKIIAERLDVNLEIPSPEASSFKIAPEKASITASELYPEPQTESELNKTKPKSGIIINETIKNDESVQDWDSFELLENRKPRPDSMIDQTKREDQNKRSRTTGSPSRKKMKRSGTMKSTSGDKTRQNRTDDSAYGTMDDSGFTTTKDSTKTSDASRTKSASKTVEKSQTQSFTATSGRRNESSLNQKENYLERIAEEGTDQEENMTDFGEEGDDGGGDKVIEELEDMIIKKLRRKVSQVSKTTSYQSKDIKSESTLMSSEGNATVFEPPLNKIIQKFRRDTEAKKYQKPKRRIKRGTLESHSFTKMNQTVLKDFYFGSRLGTMHKDDQHFSEFARGRQGICISAAAYCYSMILHPSNWTETTIDDILEAGTLLYLDSAKDLHLHEDNRELLPGDLQKYCYVGDKKIRFTVSEPEVTGMIRSEEKKVYNVSKGLKVFFNRHKAGILQTYGMSLAIWRDKHYYLFDGGPRILDLHVDPTGFAAMGNFYNIPSLVTILLERSGLENWPFVIYVMNAFKIYDKNALDVVESQTGLDVRSNYNILDDKRAVLVGSFDLADKCFDFTRKKQALTMAVICLVYTRITPPSAWQRRTIDKILTVGNQLYLECAECESLLDITLENIPASFTVGPYVFDILIYSNRASDLMFHKGKCRFGECLEEFFQKHSNCIVEIGKNVLSIWKQRNMFYCFDPYSRNNEGTRCRDGGACVSMHISLPTLLDLVVANFDDHQVMFRMHALKVVKVHRDPVQSQLFPKHLNMGDFPLENFKKYKMVKCRKPAVAVFKPVTADFENRALITLGYGEEPGASIIEVGSLVESLTLDQIPPLRRKALPKLKLLEEELELETVVIDLDSASLSDTQIDPPHPVPTEEETALVDLDESFELTQEELELEPKGEGRRGEGEGSDEVAKERARVAREMERMAKGTGEGEGEDNADWFTAMADFTQVGEGSLLENRSKINMEVNTDVTAFLFTDTPLPPTPLNRRRISSPRDSWCSFSMNIMKSPDVTQSEELGMDSNFQQLPDDTQLVRGSINLVSLGEDLEFAAPFVCIMAVAVAKKYSLRSWGGEIVDYVLRCGRELYKSSKVRYDQVTKLDIPRVSLGKTNFAIQVNYMFDTYMKKNILELAIDKILFARTDCGILVTPTYACALFYRNQIYYLFDGFGNNEVGLSEGPSNRGVACLARFKNVHALSTRIMYNKSKRESSEEVEYTRFVLSSCKVKRIKNIEQEKKKSVISKERKAEEDQEKEAQQGEGYDDNLEGEDEKIKIKTEDGEESEEEKEAEEKIKEPENLVGYKKYRRNFMIRGTTGLTGRDVVAEELKEDHFVCLCACLMLIVYPIHKWDTRKMDRVIEQGKHVYSHADNLEISDKRIIKNILIAKHYFDIVVKRITITNYLDNRNLKKGIDTLFYKKHDYFLIQFSNACYVVHKSSNDSFHLYDPYGSMNNGRPAKSGGKSTWMRFRTDTKLKRRLKQSVLKEAGSYRFYTFEVTSLRKAPKKLQLEQTIHEYVLHKKPKGEIIGKPFNEDSSWLEVEPIPWSHRKGETASGTQRGKADNYWHDWEVEYPKDLYSILATLHQRSESFPSQTRGKQTLANLVVAIGMMEIYELAEWNTAIVDSVLINGDLYMQECVKEISDENYELQVEDLLPECTIFPYSFNVEFSSIVQGTMFVMSNQQFNLFKALRFFFDSYENPCGIIICTCSEKKRRVAFGKMRQGEYFMFDCESWGAPIFTDNHGAAYILRMTTFNRLVHVLTLTLRGGDFYIYQVSVANMEAVKRD